MGQLYVEAGEILPKPPLLKPSMIGPVILLVLLVTCLWRRDQLLLLFSPLVEKTMTDPLRISALSECSVSRSISTLTDSMIRVPCHYVAGCGYQSWRRHLHSKVTLESDV